MFLVTLLQLSAEMIFVLADLFYTKNLGCDYVTVEVGTKAVKDIVGLRWCS